MMASMGWIEGVGADAVVGWLLTYAVHSTILLGAAAVVTVRLIRSDAWRETVWRAALVGALATSTLQSGLGVRPLGGEWRFSLGDVAAAEPVEPMTVLGQGHTPFDESAVETGGAPGDIDPAGSTSASGAAYGDVDPAGSTSASGAAYGDVDPAGSTSLSSAAHGDVDPAGSTSASSAAHGGAPPASSSQRRVAPPASSFERSAAPPASSFDPRAAPVWLRVLLISWAVVAPLLLGRLVLRQWLLHRFLRERRPITDGGLLSMLAALRRNAGVWRPVELTASAACPGPLALGTSEICVPERFWRDLDLEQQRSALAHELAHIARRDPGWHLLIGVIEAVFFFQPLNRVARLRLREAAEHLSDDWAVRQTGSPLGLARCLAEVASWVGRGAGPVVSGTMAMAEGGSPLLQRVERLLGGRAGHIPGRRLRTTAAIALVLSVLIAAPVVSAGDDDSDPASGALGGSGSAEHPGSGSDAAEGPSHTAAAARGGAPDVQAARNSGPGARDPAAAQEEVIRHGSPEEPLESRWQWAEAEAERRGDGTYWVAYAFERPLAAGRIHIDDSGGWSTAELDDAPLGTWIYGPSYRRPAEPGPEAEPGIETRQPVVVLLHMVRSPGGAAHVARVSVRSASAGMRLGGAPLYWLGPAVDAESFDWLRGRIDALHDARLQGAVVEALSMHETSDRVVPFLGEVIAGGRPAAVREEAVEGLAWHATAASVALLRETALSDRSRTVREEAAETLGDLGTPAAVTALDELLRIARSDAVREEAVEALAQRQQPEVLETLTRVALEDADSGVREEALDAIAGFPPSTSVPVLERFALTHPRADMRREAVEALGDVDPAVAADVLERLLESDTDSEVREEAMSALAEHRTPRALEAIFQVAMTDPDPDIQDEAVEHLGELEAAAALARLGQIVWDHPRSDLRTEAVEALAALPADIALPVLDDIVERHEDRRVVREAVEVIGEFPPDASTPRLMRIVREHRWEDVRREALDQLEDRAGSR